jgi:hypothetical protein
MCSREPERWLDAGGTEEVDDNMVGERKETSRSPHPILATPKFIGQRSENHSFVAAEHRCISILVIRCTKHVTLNAAAVGAETAGTASTRVFHFGKNEQHQASGVTSARTAWEILTSRLDGCSLRCSLSKYLIVHFMSTESISTSNCRTVHYWPFSSGGNPYGVAFVSDMPIFLLCFLDDHLESQLDNRFHWD